jgi:hypothetical protein
MRTSLKRQDRSYPHFNKNLQSTSQSLRPYNREQRKLKLPWWKRKLHLNRRSKLGVYKYSNELKKRRKNGRKRPGTLSRTITEQSRL